MFGKKTHKHSSRLCLESAGWLLIALRCGSVFCPTVVVVSELDFMHTGLKPIMASFICTGSLSVNLRFYRGEFVR